MGFRLATASFVVVFAFAAPACADDKKPRTVDDLYKDVGGLWRPTDDKKPLESLWLHQGEKAQAPQGKGTPWRVHLRFGMRVPDDFTGPPTRVEVDGDGLKIVLPPVGDGACAPERILYVQKKGDKLELRVTGTKFDGTFELEKMSSKQ